MAGGLVALLDDIAALARMAAATLDDVATVATKAATKSAGVIIDDAAVTPQYVAGLHPSRELPIIWRIARGSLFNKIIIIIPILMLLNAFAPWLLPYILILGGLYLGYEGAEKVWEKITGHHAEQEAPALVEGAKKDERQVTSGAIRTDLILSFEIMVISLNAVKEEGDFGFWILLLVLLAVALLITVVIYGAVAILVKLDDIGLKISESKRPARAKFGYGLVNAMPRVLDVISIVGTFAMLWVGGHLILQNVAEIGFTAPYDLVHFLAEPAHAVPAVGGFLAWLIDTVCALIVGFLVGSVIVGIAHLLPFGHAKKSQEKTNIATGNDSQLGARLSTPHEERKND